MLGKSQKQAVKGGVLKTKIFLSRQGVSLIKADW
jgi:hypothetical protein